MHKKIPYSSQKALSLKGRVKVPSDKSISHRALIIASQAIGTSEIDNLLISADILSTVNALKSLGVNIFFKNNICYVGGVSSCGLIQPRDVLDMGNSGTAARLLIGLCAARSFSALFTGDESLKKRTMSRIIKPLSKVGINFEAYNGEFLPLLVKGIAKPLAISYQMEVPSAQVKSSLLLYGLSARGNTIITEREDTRNHTELMLRYFGAEIHTVRSKVGNEIAMEAYPNLLARNIKIPGDPSSAAFLTVAALLIPDSDLIIENICINSTRTGLYETLIEMGGNIEFHNKRMEGNEEISDIRVKYSNLKAVTINKDLAPRMIDEYPILSIAAVFAEGCSKMLGLNELKLKESNRLLSIAEGLKKIGAKVNLGDDFLEITGKTFNMKEDIRISTNMDHRIAMSFLVLGMVIENKIIVDDISMINTSFPNFIEIFKILGVKFNAEQ